MNYFAIIAALGLGYILFFSGSDEIKVLPSNNITYENRYDEPMTDQVYGRSNGASKYVYTSNEVVLNRYNSGLHTKKYGKISVYYKVKDSLRKSAWQQSSLVDKRELDTIYIHTSEPEDLLILTKYAKIQNIKGAFVSPSGKYVYLYTNPRNLITNRNVGDPYLDEKTNKWGNLKYKNLHIYRVDIEKGLDRRSNYSYSDYIEMININKFKDFGYGDELILSVISDDEFIAYNKSRTAYNIYNFSNPQKVINTSYVPKARVKIIDEGIVFDDEKEYSKWHIYDNKYLLKMDKELNYLVHDLKTGKELFKMKSEYNLRDNGDHYNISYSQDLNYQTFVTFNYDDIKIYRYTPKEDTKELIFDFDFEEYNLALTGKEDHGSSSSFKPKYHPAYELRICEDGKRAFSKNGFFFDLENKKVYNIGKIKFGDNFNSIKSMEYVEQGKCDKVKVYLGDDKYTILENIRVKKNISNTDLIGDLLNKIRF